MSTNNPRMIKETIKCSADMEEILSGNFDQIRQGLKDLEDAFGDSYDYLEIEFFRDYNSDEYWTEINLNGFRPETPEEITEREEREKKAREKRLVQLAKDKQALEKKKKQLENKKKEIEKELSQMGN